MKWHIRSLLLVVLAVSVVMLAVAPQAKEDPPAPLGAGEFFQRLILFAIKAFPGVITSVLQSHRPQYQEMAEISVFRPPAFPH